MQDQLRSDLVEYVVNALVEASPYCVQSVRSGCSGRTDWDTGADSNSSFLSLEGCQHRIAVNSC